MFRRGHPINIPIEIIRSVVTISETGSLSKAAERLGVTQPAISAQLKRLQVLIGGPVFERTAGGVKFTARGELVLNHARKMLDANDQILSIGGAAQDSRPIRVGLSASYLDDFLRVWKEHLRAFHLSFLNEDSIELARGLVEGYVDVACLFNPPADVESVRTWNEEIVWVKAAHFVCKPGAPVPLVTWPGTVPDVSMVKALESGGQAYRVAFASADVHARIAAVNEGIGLSVLPKRLIREPTIVAKDYYLPELPVMQGAVAINPTADKQRLQPILDALAHLVSARPHQIGKAVKRGGERNANQVGGLENIITP